MSDNYQAVYDAVRSRFYGDFMDAFERALSGAFDFGHARMMMQEQISTVGYEHARPSVLFRPSIGRDGNMWCALYGEDLMDGVAGFGETPEKAMEAFDKAWREDKIPTFAAHATPGKE